MTPFNDSDLEPVAQIAREVAAAARAAYAYKRLVCALAQGAELTASRVMPFPHDYRLATRGDVWRVDALQVQELVDQKLISGEALDRLWDRVRFRVIDPEAMRRAALARFPRGFGYCPVCGALLELQQGEAATQAVRHGPRTAPCAGSGVPVSDPFYPSTGASVAA